MTDREHMRALFDEAVSLPPQDRSAFLDEACSDHPQVRQELESLLAHYEAYPEFLEELGRLALPTPLQREGWVVPGLAGTHTAFRTGQHISHFQILDKLGGGGMGVVYKALDTKLGRTVALKFLPPHLGEDAEARRRFEHEARAASALDHANICTIHEIGETEAGQLFIAMAHYAGETLREKMRQGALSPNEVVGYGRQIAAGLQRAHEAGIIHRDVKPANILVTEQGRVKLVDFGLAKIQDISLTKTGAPMGTVPYMSPEQTQGKPVDHRTDVWSFGVVLYEMLTGRRPFHGENIAAVTYAIGHHTPAPLSRLQPGLPKRLTRLVDYCLVKDPAKRCASMAEVLTHLDNLHASGGGPGYPKLAVPAIPKKGVYVLLGVLAVLMVVGAGTVAILSIPPTVPEEPLRRTQLTSYESWESMPSFSPDGNQVAFGWNPNFDYQWDIYSKQLGVGVHEPRQLTTPPGMHFAPSWSPDGQLLAFLRFEDIPSMLNQADRKGIYLMPAQGGTARKLTDFRYSSTLSWSPDSKRLFYIEYDSTAGGRARAFALSIETLEKETVTDLPADPEIEELEVQVSPDGRMLALVRGFNYGRYMTILGDLSNSNADIYVVPVSGGRARQLTFDRTAIKGIAWTPDSQEIIYASDRVHGYGNLNLWRISVEGGTPAPIYARGDRNLFPRVSPDGQRLAYVEMVEREFEIYRYKLPAEEGIHPQRELLIVSTGTERDAEYSPDGTQIVYISNRTGKFEVWVSDDEGRRSRQVTSTGGTRISTPRWSPDGQLIAFEAFENENPGVYVIPAGGGTPRSITPDSLKGVAPFWSHDGEWIYFGVGTVWKISSGGGGQPVEVVTGGSFPRESPDGQWIYYTRFIEEPDTEYEIWRISTSGRKKELVIDDLSRWFGPRNDWAVFDEGIYFMDRTGSLQDVKLKYLDINTREVATVMPVESETEYHATSMHISPDQKYLLAVVRAAKIADIDLVMLENWR